MRVIEQDTFFIASRLKEIDASYYLVYNGEKNRFEVHSSAQGESSLCVTLPFRELDARTIEYVRATRRERFDSLFKEVEQNNEEKGGSYFAFG